MVFFLTVMSVLIGFIGIAFFAVATSVLHEIIGAIGIVTAAILFSSGGICSEIDRARKQQVQLLKEIFNAVKNTMDPASESDVANGK